MNNFKLSGIREQQINSNIFESNLETFERKGYVLLEKFFDQSTILNLQEAYKNAIDQDSEFYHRIKLERTRRENGIIRQIYRYNQIFLDAIIKSDLINYVSSIIRDDWIITQQNGSHVDQGNLNKDSIGVQVWHRDFVFRHVTTSRPLLINILIPLDPFNESTGGTHILPYTHLFEKFPSKEFLIANQVQVNANPGDALILNGLTYHSAGINYTNQTRRSFNTVFGIPLLRHQVDPIPHDINPELLPIYEKFFNLNYLNNPKVEEFVRERNQ